MCPNIDYSLIDNDYMALVIDVFKQARKKIFPIRINMRIIPLWWKSNMRGKVISLKNVILTSFGISFTLCYHSHPTPLWLDSPHESLTWIFLKMKVLQSHLYKCIVIINSLGFWYRLKLVFMSGISYAIKYAYNIIWQ